MRRALVVALAALLAVLAGGVVAPTAAGAQATRPTPTLTLASQDPWTPLGGAFTMQLQTTGAVDGLDLVLTSHERLTSRSAFDETVHGGSLGSVLTLPRKPLDDFPPNGPYGQRNVSFPLTDLGISRTGGVYPVEVQLRDHDNQTVTSFVTHVVVADLASGQLEPLRVAWIWPLVAAPALRADGSADPDVLAQLQPDGRLGRQAAAIGDA
jgi:hypothetical protein